MEQQKPSRQPHMTASRKPSEPTPKKPQFTKNLTAQQKQDKRISVADIVCILLFILFGVLSRLPIIKGQPLGAFLDGVTHFGFFGKAFEVLFIIFGMISLAELTRFAVTNIHPTSKRFNTLLELCYSAANYIYVILGAILVLIALGVNVVGIATTVGILGIVVGFGAESLIADIFTGICMVFENQFNVGDIIEVGGFRGEVIQIGIRTTALKDRGGNIKIVNNSGVKDVLNCSNKSSVAVCDISISYSADLVAVEKVIEYTIAKMLREQEAQLEAGETPSPYFEEITYCGVNDLAESCVVIRVIAKATEQDIYTCNRILKREMLLAFQHYGVEIPFPQIVVHNED